MLNFNINPHGFIPFFCGIIVVILGIFVLKKNIKSKINLSYSFLCFVASIWMIFYGLSYFLNKETILLEYLFKIGYSGVIFIPIVWVQFIIYFLRLDKKEKFIPLIYFIGFIFLLLLWKTQYFMNGLYKYFWGYYPRASIVSHPFFLLFYSLLWTFGMFLLLEQYRKEDSPIRRNHIKYTIFSLFVVAFGLGDFIPNYGIEFYPLAPIWAFISISFFTYGIFRYGLLEIKVAISRLVIFIIVYGFVLGFPFWFGIVSGNWLLSTVFMAILATLGPFLYSRVRYRVEERILKEEHHMHQVLMQAST